MQSDDATEPYADRQPRPGGAAALSSRSLGDVEAPAWASWARTDRSSSCVKNGAVAIVRLCLAVSWGLKVRAAGPTVFWARLLNSSSVQGGRRTGALCRSWLCGISGLVSRARARAQNFP